MTEIDKIAQKIEENASLLSDLIEEFVKNKERKEALCQMFESEAGQLYLMSPGSSSEKYHDAYYGGLFEHSMNVFQNLIKLEKAFELSFDRESLFVTALLHDFGKAITPDLKSPHYIEAEEWKKKRGDNFEYDFSKGFFTNRDRTMFALQHFGIKLNPEEYQAILLNDGLILDANRGYSMKEYDLAFMLQVADNWSARIKK